MNYLSNLYTVFVLFEIAGEVAVVEKSFDIKGMAGPKMMSVTMQVIGHKIPGYMCVSSMVGIN